MARTSTKAKSSRRTRPARARTAGKRTGRARRARPQQRRGRSQSSTGMGLSFSAMTKKLSDVARKMAEMVSQKPEADDAIGLLEQDHRDVEQFLDQFEQAEDNQTKQQLARQICLALTVHTEIEEKQFYPTARRQGGEELTDLLDEAEVEHASAKELISQIEGMTPRDRLFHAKVMVLGEYVKHHVREEENELFPKVRDTDMDLVGLGKKLRDLKMSLLKQTAGRG